MDPIPLLDLKAQYASIREEVRDAVNRVMDSQHFILGPEVESLEREVAEYCQCRHAVGVSSGTDALLVVLMALGVRPGDEVITSAHSFLVTAGTIARLGATPVFVITRDFHQIRSALRRKSPHGREPSCRSICSVRWRTWSRFSRLRHATSFLSLKTRRRRSARNRQEDVPVRRGMQDVLVFTPPRTLAGQATVGW
jgi:hypothetical protein